MLSVALTDDHDLSTAADVRQALVVIGDAGLVVLDLGACTFIDLTVLGVIAAAATRMTHYRGELVILSAQGVVARVLELTGLDEVVRCYPRSSAALRAG